MGRMLWPSGQTAAPTPIAAKSPAFEQPRPAARRTAGGKPLKISERLDPTLDLDLLGRSEQIKYAGNGRNIFVPGSEPVIEKPLKNPAIDQRAQIAKQPTGPPPINLKFFGFASKPGEPKRVFLSSQEGDVFIASEGEIVNRRYRVVHIAPTSIDVEDVLYNNRQSIPLTQG